MNKMVKLWIYWDFVVVEVWGQVEEEVAAVEVDDVVHKGPDKKGRVLWVVSHTYKYFGRNKQNKSHFFL